MRVRSFGILGVGVGVLDDPTENLTSMGKFSEREPNCRLTADGTSRTPSPTGVYLQRNLTLQLAARKPIASAINAAGTA